MAKLSVRAAYWIGCLVPPVIMAAILIVVLLTTHYGDNLPLFFKIAAPIFLCGLTAWWALAKFKKAKDDLIDHQ
jgi:hypothetical protein